MNKKYQYLSVQGRFKGNLKTSHSLMNDLFLNFVTTVSFLIGHFHIFYRQTNHK